MRKPIKMHFYEFEWNGNSDLTFEQKIELLRQTGINAEREFTVKYAELVNWYKEYNQLYILSFCMFYFMINFDGRDEEAETGTLEFSPYFMELLQAFALTIPYTFSGKPLNNDVYNLQRTIKELGDLNSKKHLNIPNEITTFEKLMKHQLRVQMMLQTTAVRNWSYEHQMQNVVNDLAISVNNDFKQHYGFDGDVIMSLLFSLISEVENRVNNHAEKIRSFLAENDLIAVQNEYERVFENVQKSNPETKKQLARKFKSVTELKSILMMHSDLQLQELFTFDVKDMIELSNSRLKEEDIRVVFNQWSLEFDELKDNNIEYFILDNPVQSKPFINLGADRYYSSLWTVMTHSSISLLEGLIKADKNLTTRYNKTRGVYLEEQVELLFKKAFPEALIYTGSQWEGEDKKLFENDLLVIIDSFAIVVEAKAGSISPPAKRGAPDRLFKTLQELIDEPSTQALGFIEYLKKNNKKLNLSTVKGKKNILDASKLKFFIPLGVTLSHLGSISTNLKLLIESGVTNKKINQLAPSISLTDLQIIFDFLPSIAQKVHYLQRRREIESNINYIGDEIDLLAWYIDSTFSFGKIEYEKNNYYNISLKSKELDYYIIQKARGMHIENPILKLTKWWQDLLNHLESSKKQLWLENCFILLNISFEAQQYFENMLQDMINKIKSGTAPQRHNWVMMDNAIKDKRYVIIGYPYMDKFKDERDAIIEEILFDEKNKAQGILLLGINIDKNHYPYSILAAILSSQLFDKEFLEMINIC